MRHAYRVPERGAAAPVPALRENGATAAVPRDSGRSFVPAAGKPRRFRRFWGLLGLLALLLAKGYAALDSRPYGGSLALALYPLKETE